MEFSWCIFSPLTYTLAFHTHTRTHARTYTHTHTHTHTQGDEEELDEIEFGILSANTQGRSLKKKKS